MTRHEGRTLGELRGLATAGTRPSGLMPQVQSADASLAYHGRLALAAAPLLLTLVALALASLTTRRRSLVAGGWVTIGAYFSALLLTMSPPTSAAPAALHAWAPNIALLLLALALHRAAMRAEGERSA